MSFCKTFIVSVVSFFFLKVHAQELKQRMTPGDWVIQTNFYGASIVKNSPSSPKAKHPFLLELIPSVQTNGSKDWQQIFGYPEVGCSLFMGQLGNEQVLGNVFGAVPFITFNAANPHWYVPRISLGIGLAYFNKPFSAIRNPGNTYIGSTITAMAYTKAYFQTRLSDHLSFNAGIMTLHCSNGHYQVPNLGMNMPAFFMGFKYSLEKQPLAFKRREINIPKGKLQFNFRTGIGVHVLAQTLGPTGTAKYAIYVNDFFVSKRFGKASNVQAGLEWNFYNSYYSYIKKTKFFTDHLPLKASVITLFLAHELMIHRVSLLTQGGINLYNPFYRKYIALYKSQQGVMTDLKKIFSTRLGVQYYFFDPDYCTRNNIYVGAYIKANFGQADFICTQLGFVF